MKVEAFVPIKADSERLHKKNTRDFAGYKGGLSAVKLKQLSNLHFLDRIVVSTNEPMLLDFIGGSINALNLTIVDRPEKYYTTKKRNVHSKSKV